MLLSLFPSDTIFLANIIKNLFWCSFPFARSLDSGGAFCENEESVGMTKLREGLQELFKPKGLEEVSERIY